MIVFDRLWGTMKKKGVTTYTLRVKNNMSSATVQRLKKNLPVSTYTIDNLCRILECTLDEIMEYKPD